MSPINNMTDPNENFIYRLNNGVGNSSTGNQYDNQNPAIDEDAVQGMIATAMRTQTEHMQMVGAEYKSQNFKTGVSGWQIDGQGNAEFNNGTFRGTFQLGGTLITVSSIANLASAITTVSTAGGGTVALVPGTYNATISYIIPSNVTIDGNGATIDFGATANNFSAIGTNPYSTGTLAVNFNSGSVTGTGTTWTAAMIGRSILIGDYWYSITARASNTAITISPVFRAPNVSGVTYVIATTVDGVALLNITLTNNITNPIFDFRYCNGILMDSLICSNSPQGLRGRDSGNIQWLGSVIQTCTAGMLFNNVPFCTLSNFLVADISGGTGMDLTGVTNTAISPGSIQNITGVGMKFTNCSNLGFLNYSIIETTSHGIEFVSGNSDTDLASGYINTAGGDGVKLTASSNRIEITTTNVLNTTGYQFNIANANCNSNMLTANTADGTGSGAIQNLGTGTRIAPDNVGFSGNVVEGDLSLTDITTNNASTSKHGFVPKLPNDATKFYDGTGNYSTISAPAVTDVQTFNANGTWTKPTNAKSIKIQIWGGGGGGGGCNGAGSTGGGGGGGGAYIEINKDASLLGSTVTVTVGASAAGGIGVATPPTVGNNSTFGTFGTAYGGGTTINGNSNLTAGGGGGGAMGGGNNGNNTTGGTAGIPADGSFGGGGAGGNSATIGNLAFFGGGGGGGANSGTGNNGGASVWGGGGGAGGGLSGVGTGGLSSNGGNGGTGGNQSDGSNGTAPGGGGGGGGNNSVAKNGGAGAAGRITVTTYF